MAPATTTFCHMIPHLCAHFPFALPFPVRARQVRRAHTTLQIAPNYYLRALLLTHSRAKTRATRTHRMPSPFIQWLRRYLRFLPLVRVVPPCALRTCLTCGVVPHKDTRNALASRTLRHTFLSSLLRYHTRVCLPHCRCGAIPRLPPTYIVDGGAFLCHAHLPSLPTTGCHLLVCRLCAWFSSARCLTRCTRRPTTHPTLFVPVPLVCLPRGTPYPYYTAFHPFAQLFCLENVVLLFGSGSPCSWT